MEPRELLEALVTTVATLGELAATVARPDGDMQLAAHTRSLREILKMFTCQLCDALRHRDVTSLEQRGVTSLGQALATLGATPGTTWAEVTAAFRAWLESMDTLAKSWWWVDGDATDLLDAWEYEGTAEATTEATARAGDLRDETTARGTAGDNLVAAAQQPPVALPSVVAAHNTPVVAATKAMQEVMGATSQAGTATRRGQRAEVALGLLGRLVVACDEASAFPWELQRRLGDIELALAETKEASRDVPKALVAAVAEFERLWEASFRLGTDYLVGALEDIKRLLSSPGGSPGGPGGPGGPTVAERCQKAIENIPRLLGGQ